MKIALVTAQPVIDSGEDVDIAPIARELRVRDVEVDVLTWDDADARWDSYSSIVIRSPWDYAGRYAEFLGWMSSIEPLGSVRNCPHTIRWNLDKRYLEDLRMSHIPVVPTWYCNSRSEAFAALATVTSQRVVIKPNISAGARDTGLFNRDDSAVEALVDRIIEAGKIVMLQPEIESVTEHGEHALLYFNGTFSHAFGKGPILTPGGGLVGGRYQESITAVAPDRRELALGSSVLQAVGAVMKRRGCNCGGPLYARLDLVQDGQELRLLEAELFEPAFYLQVADGSVGRFVDALLQRDPSGLDPK